MHNAYMCIRSFRSARLSLQLYKSRRRARLTSRTTPPRSRDVSGCQRCVSECLNLLQFCHRCVTDMSRDVTEMSPIGHKLVTRCHGDVAACHTEISHDMSHDRGVLLTALYPRRVARYSISQNVLAQTINVITRCHVSQDCHRNVTRLSRHVTPVVTDVSRHVTEMSRLSHKFVTSCHKMSQRPSHQSHQVTECQNIC